MTVSDFGFVCTRILGLVICLVHIVTVWGGFSFVYLLEDASESKVHWIYPSAVWLNFALLCLGVVLFVWARPISRRLFGNDSTASALLPTNHVQVVAFSIVGVVFFVFSLPDFLVAAAKLFLVTGESAPYGSESLVTETALTALGLGLRVILGVFLFTGAYGLSRFWSRLRGAEYNPQDPASTVTTDRGDA